MNAKGKAVLDKLKGKSENRPPVSIGGDKLKKLMEKARAKELRSGIWKPEVEGDMIAGKVLGMEEEQTKFGKQLNVTIDTPEGPKSLFCNTWLENALKAEGVAKGDIVAICFRGRVPTKRKGKPSKAFTVVKG